MEQQQEQQSNFITYDTIKGILEKHQFYGRTAKRVGDRKITYMFYSYKWYNTVISIETMRIPSKRIVLGIKINDKIINSYKEFLQNINGIYNINRKHEPNKENKYHHNRNNNSHNSIPNNDENIQMVSKTT